MVLLCMVQVIFVALFLPFFCHVVWRAWVQATGSCAVAASIMFYFVVHLSFPFFHVAAMYTMRFLYVRLYFPTMQYPSTPPSFFIFYSLGLYYTIHFVFVSLFSHIFSCVPRASSFCCFFVMGLIVGMHYCERSGGAGAGAGAGGVAAA